MTDRIHRRAFIDQSKRAGLGLAAGLTLLGDPRSVRAAPAADKIIMGIVGCRNRGPGLVDGFLDRGDCEFAYLADINVKQHSYAEKFAERQGGRRPKCVQDFRRLLEDKTVDAVVLALPPHWHSLAAIWSCQAEKDIYVEKPPSHNCWEGRQFCKAARKYGRVVQVGTQNRSAPYNISAKKYIDEGGLGEIHLCRVFQLGNWDRSVEIGPDSDPPDGFNWDMWNGPAPARAYNTDVLALKYRLWDYGAGLVVADGIHQLDLARWLCGVDYPKSVYSTGGRFHTTGDAQTPDTQTVVWEFDKMLMQMEYTGFSPYILKTPGDIRASDTFPYWLQNATRIEIYGSKAMMIMGRHGGGWQVFVRPENQKPVVEEQMFGRHPDPHHKEDFVQAIRTRRRANADIEEGHRSVLLSHYGTISYRLGGRKLRIDRKTEQILDDAEAMKLFKRSGREPWVIPEEV